MKILKISASILATLCVIFVCLGFFVSMIKYSTSVVINASPGKCWNTFHDTTKMKQWIEGLESFKQIKGDTMVPGAIYEMVIVQDERMVMQEEVKELAPLHVVYELHNDVLISKYAVDFIGEGQQTRIVINYAVTGNNLLWKSVFVVSKSYFQDESQKQLDLLKKIVESSPNEHEAYV